ncbi:MAG TPA: phosphatidate cytidylyltransferase [Gammaproteobacteria bacterium]|nr:phosphatidate cytidylyltransferase [Gammaproteobacteria bacterium]
MLVTRVITGAILGVALVATLLFLPTLYAAAVLALLWLAGAWEWARLARLEGPGRAGYVAVVALGMVLLFRASPVTATPMLIIALVWWTVALAALLSAPHTFGMAAVAAAGLVVLLPSWLLLMVLHGAGQSGPGLALTALVVVWAADVGAYGVGRRFGRVKLAPKISPGKTWEGLGGGVALAAAAAWAAALVLDLPQAEMVVLGVLTALVSVVGDLTVSMFKRNVGLKDSGALLPGHGGVMDRIDSLTAAVPVFMLGARLIGIEV